MLEGACDFCDNVVRETTSERLKEKGRTHLKKQHLDVLEDAIQENWTGNEYISGCGYGFPFDSDSHPGFECPECGTDHFNYYARNWVF